VPSNHRHPTRAHRLVRLLVTWLAATALVAAAGPPAATAAPARAGSRSAGGASAADCGCLEVGAYQSPKGIVAPHIEPDGSSRAADPRYRVTATGSLPAIDLVVRRVSDGSVVLHLSTAATNWGFSPDQDRFVTHRVNGGQLEAQLYNLTGSTPSVPVVQHSVATSDARLGFSPKGRYFALTWLWSSSANTVGTVISDAGTGTKVYDTTYSFYVPASSGKKFGEAGWGFSPDDGEFFQAWVTGQSTVQLALVNLATHSTVWSPTMTGTGFWMFSPCGSMLALVEQHDPTTMDTVLVRASNGTTAATRSDNVGDISFRATEASHIATVDGVDHVLAANAGPTTCPDSEAPTWPSPATLEASGVGADRLTLTWSAAADDVGVIGYRVYRGATLLDTVPGDRHTLAVTGLAAGTSYSFSVQAGDAAGHWTTDGPTTGATTTANLPTWPAGSWLVADDVATTTLTLRWSAAQDTEGVTGYRVFDGAAELTTLPGTARRYDVTGLAGGTTHTFRVEARDGDGHQSTDGPTATATTDAFAQLDTNAIRGQVYSDSNHNGIHDAGEPGVDTEHYPFVGFYAYRIDGTSYDLQSATSGSSNGLYSFDDLADGRWLVSLIIWPRIQTSPGDLQPQIVDVVGGKGYDKVDFGVVDGTFPDSGDASLAGTVWNDTDADGVRDAGETGRPGVELWCYSVPYGSGCGSTAPPASGASGAWAMGGLAPGTLQLGLEPLPEGLYPTTGGRVVAVSSHESVAGLDFGVVEGTASVSGVLFHDADGDGARDAGEETLPGPDFSVCAVNDRFDLFQCADPDAAGAYEIGQLPPGAHTLVVRGPDGWESTPGRTVTVSAPGQVLTGVDVGADGPSAVVHGIAWDDLDRDGTRDAGEPGLADVRICLYDGSEGGRCEWTDDTGHYRADYLPAGHYGVSASAPDGYRQTSPAEGYDADLADGGELVADFGFAAETSALPPGAPTALAATPGNGRVTLSWTAPADDGGAAVTDYVVQAAPSGGDWATVDDGASDATTATVSGLGNGTTYRFRVAARNEAGDGDWAVSGPVTPRTTPGAPRSLAAKAGARLVRLSWRAPAADGGAAVTDYRIQRAARRTGGWTTVREGVSTRATCTVRGLKPGKAYFFRVLAVNAAGSGRWSAVVRARPHR
jgi:fibronectin type III domain protein/SdrD B-like protein